MAIAVESCPRNQLRPMQSDIATAKRFATYWDPAHRDRYSIDSEALAWPCDSFASRLRGFCDYQVMTRLPRFLTPLLAGCAVTLLQVVIAVALLAPEKPVVERYSALVQHDSYWFMNIIDRGYRTIVPPIDHKVMEFSNARFFRHTRRSPRYFEMHLTSTRGRRF